MAEALPTLLLVDDQPTVRKLLEVYVRGRFQVVGQASNGHEAIRIALEARPELVLMDLDMPAMGGIEATRRLRTEVPEMSIVIASGQSDTDSLRQAMAAGAREYLIKPFDKDEVLACLDRIVGENRQRRQALEVAAGRDEPVPGAGTWCFLGAGGGDGRTTAVLGMAAELRTLGHTVVVVDLDPLFGDVAFYLGLEEGPPDLAELLEQEHFLEAEVIARHLKTHSSGIQVLAWPTRPGRLLEVDMARVAPLLEVLESMVDYVLVDMTLGLTEAGVSLLDRSRFVFPVAAMQPNQLKNLKVMHGILSMLGYPATKLRPILTRTSEEAAAAWIDTVQIDIARVLPADARAAEEAVRRGLPVTMAAPGSPLGQALREFLAPLLHLPPPAEAAPRSLLARLLG